MIETAFELMKKTMESGEDVLISGFGKFSVKKKASRKGRNPATGEQLPLDARTVVTFRCSGVMRDRING
jgi:integration host factor subunit alpha